MALRLITKKEFKVSLESVKAEDIKLRKFVFDNIKIMYNTSDGKWYIIYDKKYLDGYTTLTEQIEEIGADGNPTGNMIDPTPQPILKDVLVKPHQVEPITNAQYTQIEAMVKAEMTGTYTTAELLTNVLAKGIPLFIDLFGFYEGTLKKEDFELF